MKYRKLPGSGMRAIICLLISVFLPTLLLTACSTYKGTLMTQSIGAIEPSATYNAIR